jgi:hypothetical protein
MNKRNIVCSLAVLVALTCAAFAQDADTLPAKPMFGHLPPHQVSGEQKSPAALATYQHTFDFSVKGCDPCGNETITQVGTDPSSTNTTTTVPVVIIPVKLGYQTSTGTTYFDPLTKLSNGRTAVSNTEESPIFQPKVNYTQGGTNLGTTQYEDAWARGDFWTNVMTNTNWHLKLGVPKIAPEQTFTVPKADGSIGVEFGVTVGLADINWFDSQIQTMLTKLKITPNEIPIFITYDVYLTEFGECCIGGYHDANTNGQTYSNFEYIGTPGVFSQDVSALSHELGEWIADPMVNNSGCGGLLEVGDPLENESNYGAYPYTLNGFTYNLQDLVFMSYFGQSPVTSVNSWLTFQDSKTVTKVCQTGQ